MTRADLVRAVAECSDLIGRDAEEIVHVILGGIVEALQSEDKVEIRGFGSFRVRETAPRRYRNPATGEIHVVPGKRVVRFKAGKPLLDMINT